MDDTILEGSFILAQNRPDGTLLSPGCKLVLTYECTDRVVVDLPDKGKKGKGSRGDKTIEDIKSKLCSVLEQIDGMLNYGTRTYLVDVLSQYEKERIKRHEADMRIDLGYIVDHFTYVGKLEALVERAKNIARSPAIESELEKICQEHRELRTKEESKKSVFTLTPGPTTDY